jgi:hypothetical protein
VREYIDFHEDSLGNKSETSTKERRKGFAQGQGLTDFLQR